MLRRHRVALVVADTAGRWPLLEDLTADFVYLRLHGKGEIYAGGYDDSSLDDWAVRLRAWTCGAEPADAKRILGRPAPRARRRDAYVYFDNDAKVRAPFDALALRRRLGLVPGCHDVRVAPAAPRLTAEEIEARRVVASARWKRG
jgi:uncharacterized protein YecE (DUF72 family)